MDVRNPRKAQFNAIMRSSKEATYFIIIKIAPARNTGGCFSVFYFFYVIRSDLINVIIEPVYVEKVCRGAPIHFYF